MALVSRAPFLARFPDGRHGFYEWEANMFGPQVAQRAAARAALHSLSCGTRTTRRSRCGGPQSTRVAHSCATLHASGGVRQPSGCRRTCGRPQACLRVRVRVRVCVVSQANRVLLDTPWGSLADAPEDAATPPPFRLLEVSLELDDEEPNFASELIGSRRCARQAASWDTLLTTQLTECGQSSR